MLNVWEHFGPFFLMAALTLASQATTRNVHNRRTRNETRRLRSVLTIGLQALRKLYEDNLIILAKGNRPLVSGRNQITMLRIQFSRLICLGEAEIESVLAASIAADAAEAAMAIAGKAVGGVAFTVPEETEARATLESALMEACSMLGTAGDFMAPADRGRGKKQHEEGSKALSRTSSASSTFWPLPAPQSNCL